jgi:hypothetical protein
MGSSVLINSLQGETAHHHRKELFRRTNKYHFHKQFAVHNTRIRFINAHTHLSSRSPAIIKKKKKRSRAVSRKSGKPLTLGFDASEPLPYTKPGDRYHISDSVKFPVLIHTWLKENEGDVALNVGILFFSTLFTF